MTQAQATFAPIQKVVSAGLMTLDREGNFNSARILTRAELATILVKTFKLEKRATAQKPNLEVEDVPTDHWAYDAIQVVLKTGIMSGYREGMFFPSQRVNRAEAFAIFAQAYGVFQFPDDTVDEIIAQYPDAGEIPEWAKKSIATALQEGFVNTQENNEIQPLESMTRADMAYAVNQYLEKQQQPGSMLF